MEARCFFCRVGTEFLSVKQMNPKLPTIYQAVSRLYLKAEARVYFRTRPFIL